MRGWRRALTLQENCFTVGSLAAETIAADRKLGQLATMAVADHDASGIEPPPRQTNEYLRTKAHCGDLAVRDIGRATEAQDARAATGLVQLPAARDVGQTWRAAGTRCISSEHRSNNKRHDPSHHEHPQS